MVELMRFKVIASIPSESGKEAYLMFSVKYSCKTRASLGCQRTVNLGGYPLVFDCSSVLALQITFYCKGRQLH